MKKLVMCVEAYVAVEVPDDFKLEGDWLTEEFNDELWNSFYDEHEVTDASYYIAED